MRTVFADTFYFIAQFNPADEAHVRAKAFTDSFDGQLITTEWVLVEVGDAFSRLPNRTRFVNFYQLLQRTSGIAIVPVELAGGFQLFANRPDKEWSLTDCLSFVAMHAAGIDEALTGDHHFEQAGFQCCLTALIRSREDWASSSHPTPLS